MKIYTVRLEDDTIGIIRADGSLALLDKPITVNLHDENGNPVQATGKVVEIMEVREEWE